MGRLEVLKGDDPSGASLAGRYFLLELGIHDLE
jgi:hypothetical protein